MRHRDGRRPHLGEPDIGKDDHQRRYDGDGPDDASIDRALALNTIGKDDQHDTRPDTRYDEWLGALEAHTESLPNSHFSTFIKADVFSMMVAGVALCLRLSTNGQAVKDQRRELTATVEHHGWTVVAEYVDQGISRAKGRDRRPAFDRLMKASTAWSVNRLGRSLQDKPGGWRTGTVGRQRMAITYLSNWANANWWDSDFLSDFLRRTDVPRTKPGIAQKIREFVEFR
jgi:hypothetical protein